MPKLSDIELLQRCCRQFNAGTMIEFAAYVLYYTANPETKMDIPNCVYEKVEKIYADWNEQHKNDTHNEDEVSRVDEQQSVECIPELEVDISNGKSHICLEALIKQEAVKEASTELMLKELKDRGVIRSWYYNGTYHVGNELS